MLLAIDIGNTNVCCAVFDGPRELAVWRSSSDHQRTSDEWAVWLINLLRLKGISLQDIDAAIISAVVPEILVAMRTFCQNYLSAEVIVVGEKKGDIAIQALIDNPDEVGADLLVNAISAHTSYGGPLLVVDFGTATTVSLVDSHGNFCGASIAPGINLSLQALYNATAKLPHISFAKPAKVIGTNTVESMRSGVFWGYISMVEGLVERAQNEYARKNPEFLGRLKVIATGGLSSLIASETKAIDFHDTDLTLKGLYIIYTLMKTCN